MSPIPRQKACIACAESKRRCDKQAPECQRCLDRDVDCVYPQPKRRRKNAPLRYGQAEAAFLAQDAGVDINVDFFGRDLNLGGWDPSGAPDPVIPLSDVINPYVPPAPMSNSSASNAPNNGRPPETSSKSDTSSLWFLQEESWVMQYNHHDPECVASIDFESFVRAAEGMLQGWVKDGHNSFIHRRLYEKGLPTCVQDAFTTLAAYTSRAPAVKETILQIADDRAAALVAQPAPIGGGVQAIRAHLARAQALFVYQFMRLFDGSVRFRASAERQLPTMRHWLKEMREAVTQYRGEDLFSGSRPLHWAASEFDREYGASSEMWRLWILTESLRRTHLIADTIANIYQIMSIGLVECSGFVMFTARRGLWDAESAVKWVELCCAKPALLVPSLKPEPLISQYAAEEVDEFAKLCWTYIVGQDKIQSWVDRSKAMDRMST